MLFSQLIVLFCRFFQELLLEISEIQKLFPSSWNATELMTEGANNALAHFLSSPVHLGAFFTASQEQKWRVTIEWYRLLADRVDLLMRKYDFHVCHSDSRKETEELLSSTLTIIGNGSKFMIYHKKRLAKRLLDSDSIWCSDREHFEKFALDHLTHARRLWHGVTQSVIQETKSLITDVDELLMDTDLDTDLSPAFFYAKCRPKELWQRCDVW